MNNEDITEWMVEGTEYQLIPEPNEGLYDGVFIVKGFVIKGNEIENCFMDIFIPERISEMVFRLVDNNFTIDNANEKELKAIPSVASECYGDYELYYSTENPKIGIDILRKGLELSLTKNVIAEDLGYILRDENRIEEAIEMFKISEKYNPSSEYTNWNTIIS